MADRGVRVRHGDFADPASLAAAFEGAAQLLIVSSNAAATGGDPLAQHQAAIDAAKAAGIRRIVYTSHIGVGDTSRFPPMRDHAATERMLAASGVAWTAVRNGFYASTVPRIVGDAAKSGTIAAPLDGKVSWTAHADLAAAATRVLHEEGRFDGPTPPLTASETLDLSDVAAILSELTGRTVNRHVLADQEYAVQMADAGMSSNGIEDHARSVQRQLLWRVRRGRSHTCHAPRPASRHGAGGVTFLKKGCSLQTTLALLGADPVADV